MKRILALAVIAIAGFYVAWPAWSGYVIRDAIQSKDTARLAAKVDFDRVQASLRPTVTRKVEEGFDRYQSQLGGAGAMILGQLRKDAVPKIVEASLKALLTPDMIIRITSEGGSIKDSLDRIMREQIGRLLPAGGAGGDNAAPSGQVRQGLGGLLGKALPGAAPAPAAPEAAAVAATVPVAGSPGRSLSVMNIKSFSFVGPVSFRVGVAKESTAVEPDITAEMSFIGGDWKLTGLVPKL